MDRFKLVEDWRDFWKWWSVRFQVLTAATLVVIQTTPVIPPDVQAAIPQPWGGIVTALWTLIAIYSRVARQADPK